MITNTNENAEQSSEFDVSIVDCKISIGTINKTSTVYNKDEFVQTLQYNIATFHQILQNMLYDRYVEEISEETKKEYFDRCSKFVIGSGISLYPYFNTTTDISEIIKRIACDAIIIFNALYDALQKSETTTENESNDSENVENT